MKTSIYKNYSILIKSVITLLEIKENNTITNLKQLNKNNKIIGYKINNKIYLAHQLNSKNLQFIYKLNHMNTTQTLKTMLSSFKLKTSK